MSGLSLCRGTFAKSKGMGVQFFTCPYVTRLILNDYETDQNILHYKYRLVN